jgi:hypothetical protein
MGFNAIQWDLMGMSGIYIILYNGLYSGISTICYGELPFRSMVLLSFFIAIYLNGIRKNEGG